MILKKDIIIALSKKLSLPYKGTEQDWDIEMADSSRINEFIDLYHQHDLAFEERMALMSLIVASYDDYLNEHDLAVDCRWDRIKATLTKDKRYFIELIDYWSLDNEDDIFRITPLMRTI
ncbi:hypothetical protein [Sphingobacterium athyrii]|uniref:Uncharacterized protein n=1 Tax=Sphingobacterium athyrii TaxID=2152717 RepID=A0A363P0D2_9SPHI|nr:hypothetical protein [Sphingobacterium athyrii]PUV26333.1 hypothetical protein DCO56_05120 [Sphingobacterium athyrii]